MPLSTTWWFCLYHILVHYFYIPVSRSTQSLRALHFDALLCQPSTGTCACRFSELYAPLLSELIRDCDLPSAFRVQKLNFPRGTHL
jgi:hypothetical protein